MLRVLQMCNVGNIVGGTAACAWSVTKALPDCEHTVWFRSTPTAQTRLAFNGHRVETVRRCSFDRVGAGEFDVILLHNTPAAAVDWQSQQPQLSCPVLLYQHSRNSQLAGHNSHAFCSHALAEQCNRKDGSVLHQGVPRSCSVQPDTRALGERFVVGRICTPTARKWPGHLPDFYEALATRHPDLDWEFVGCPPAMQARMTEAVRGRCRFHPAEWQARRHLQRWHVLLYHQPDLPETFGRTCAEAMRQGTVPVVDALGGFVEQLPAGTGVLCTNEKAFGDALEELKNLEEWPVRSRACREVGEADFSLKAFRVRLLAWFAKVGL